MRAAAEKLAGRLIAVDGVNGSAIMKAARAAVADVPKARRAGVSLWDASGLFGDLMIAPPAAGTPSARTLVLLYAADLAFRLRWEIHPALEAGKTAVVAPYTGTAIAFGRAAGLDAGWLNDLFGFAPAAHETLHVLKRLSPRAGGRAGFVELGRECLALSSPAMAGKIGERAVSCLRRQ
jgi:thymidylate kinase